MWRIVVNKARRFPKLGVGFAQPPKRTRMLEVRDARGRVLIRVDF